MTMNNNKTIFYLLDQQGLFRTTQKPPDSPIFAGTQGRKRVKKLFDMRLEIRYRTVRNQVSDFLNVSTCLDLITLKMDENLRQQAGKELLYLPNQVSSLSLNCC